MKRESGHQGLVQRKKELEREPHERTDVEEELVKTKDRLERLVNTIPCAVYDYVLWPNGDSRFIYISPQCLDIFEYDADRIVEDPNLLWGMVHQDDMKRLQLEDRVANKDGSLFRSEVRITLPSGGVKWIELTSMPSLDHFNGQTIWSGVVLDISGRKKAEEERNQLILDLQQALAKVKKLSGLLPICASCKKIRDDKGYWNQIESYIADHSEVEFSHGVCPECARKLFPSLKPRANN